MELDDAILHLEESLSDEKKEWSCESCKQEHIQLLNWLKDYKRLLEDQTIPKGTWDKRIIQTPSGKIIRFYCSNCNKHNDRWTDFCPNCGADMR